MPKIKKPKFGKGIGGAALQLYISLGQTQAKVTRIDPSGFIQLDVTSTDASAANAEIQMFLSKLLGIEITKIDILFGKYNLHKLIAITGKTALQVEQKLSQL